MPPDKAGTVSGGLTKSTLSPVRSSKPNRNQAVGADVVNQGYNPLESALTSAAAETADHGEQHATTSKSSYIESKTGATKQVHV